MIADYELTWARGSVVRRRRHGGGLSFPGADGEDVNHNAEEIGGDEAGLMRLEADSTDQQAIQSRHDEASPELSRNQNRGQNSQQTGDVIQPEHRGPRTSSPMCWGLRVSAVTDCTPGVRIGDESV